jgi:hypothetical protein
MQAAYDVKEAEEAERKQAQEIRKMEKDEQNMFDEHRFVATKRGQLEKEYQKVTEEAQTSRCCPRKQHATRCTCTNVLLHRTMWRLV